ncbi:hypothetical protein T4B_7545 [Trichinella pseudospiralis]|uniref:Uncharacterized protein n=1 Tax=Trichinella pseudospiralis TaxID=6337 RepID=A0A0V1GKC5_TRIPS|nr:hypothetical protein T4B_7545 [Trichinella pseudospiralis]
MKYKFLRHILVFSEIEHSQGLRYDAQNDEEQRD